MRTGAPVQPGGLDTGPQRADLAHELWHRHPAEDLDGLSRSEVLKASPRMFDSDLLDKLSRVHPAVPPILFGPAIAFGSSTGSSRGRAGRRRCG